jgi:autotransporter-associated beta strand protein
VYEGSLTKRGDGTLFLTGTNTWHGESTVRDGKLSVVGSHAGEIEVRDGSIGGSGSVEDDVNVTDGVLRPGLSAAEAELIGDEVTAGNVLTVDGDVRIDRDGRFAVTISGDDDYTSVVATDDLELDGRLSVEVDDDLTRGTVLTIMDGGDVDGRFRGLQEGDLFREDGHTFRVSYRNDRVTLTVVRR